MNRVSVDNEGTCIDTTIAELVDNWGQEETAFIGKCGIGPGNTLYLLCYGTIVEAGEPQRTWVNRDCPVKVHCFVDVDMTVRAKR